MAKNVVIGGGTGFIGKALSKLLKSNGYNVTIVSRSLQGPDTITWDYIRENGLPPNTDVVINFSGAKIVDPKFRFRIDEYKQMVRDSRINTTKWLRDAIASALRKPKVWISSSAVGAYDPSYTAVYDEDSPRVDGAYPTAMCREWESTAKLPKECSSTREIIIRIGAVLGKEGMSTKGLLRMFQLGFGGTIGSGRQWYPWIHLDDVTGIYLHCIENDGVFGVLNAVSPNTVTVSEFTSICGSVLHRPSCCRYPEWLLRFIMGNDWANIILKGCHVVPKRTLQFNYSFKFLNLEDALKEVVG